MLLIFFLFHTKWQLNYYTFYCVYQRPIHPINQNYRYGASLEKLNLELHIPVYNFHLPNLVLKKDNILMKWMRFAIFVHYNSDIEFTRRFSNARVYRYIMYIINETAISPIITNMRVLIRLDSVSIVL